jgi:glycosyltransferase involved in cell wall biosynthesis
MNLENYENELLLWRNLVNESKQISLASNEIDNAKKRAEIVNRADEMFYSVAEYELHNPKEIKKPLNVFAPTMTNTVWTNILLARDKGYTPYFLSQATGGRCVFFFCDENDPLPVSEALPGAEFVRKNSPSKDDYISFIKYNVDEIDILVTDDIAGDSFSLMPIYKSLKPDGKILHTTDINRFYYKLQADEAIFGRFGEALKLPDVYTAASHLGRDLMNEDPRFPKPVYCSSNAYLPDKNADGEIVTAVDKENIIITAGRIGSYQKNNMPLIRAFLYLADDLPDWRLVLAGPCAEADKKALINDAFRGMRYRPDLGERIIFTGGLSKTDLYKYYKKAKIMAITSPSEGGTPNVFSEALAHGCFMVIADRLDGLREMTEAFGRNIGTPYRAMEHTKIYENLAFEIDENAEAVSLANTLAAILQNLTESFFEAHIKKCLEYLDRDFDYKKNSIKLLHLLCD